jgi:hypothetical protein
MESLSRRDFAGMVPALLAIAGMLPGTAEGQSTAATGTAPAGTAGPRPLKEISSGVFKPQPGKGMQGGHESHQFVSGMLKAGNIRLESMRPRNAPFCCRVFVMNSVYERRVWSGGWSSWPSGDRAAGKFVWDERDGTK